jgi:hypothetical protein
MKKLFSLLILFSFAFNVIAKTGTVKGRVIDESTAYGIASAQIKVTDENSSAIFKTFKADVNGDYTITGLPQGNYTLQYSYTGYWTQSISGLIVSAGKTTNINISLKPEAKTK